MRKQRRIKTILFHLFRIFFPTFPCNPWRNGGESTPTTKLCLLFTTFRKPRVHPYFCFGCSGPWFESRSLICAMQCNSCCPKVFPCIKQGGALWWRFIFKTTCGFANFCFILGGQSGVHL